MRFIFSALAGLLFLLPQTVFSQKTNAKPPEPPKVVTGTVLLNDIAPPDAKALLAALRSDWSVRADSVRNGDKTLVFSSSAGAMVMIAWLDYPVAPAEIQGASAISVLWPNAALEAGGHKAQAVISVIGPESRTLDLYKLFTRVAAGLMEQSRAAGIYLSGQYLLVPKGYFLISARNMSDTALPLGCWIYFGLRQDGAASGGYTFGMREFGLPEMEVVNSTHSPQDVYAILNDAADFAIRTNTHYRAGQFFNSPNGQKIPLQVSASVFLENEKTVKLQF